MSFFGGIGHFFSSLFGPNGDVAQKVLHAAASYISLAVPIIAEIEADLKAETGQGSVGTEKVIGFIQKFEPDSGKAQSIATSLGNISNADLWHQLAVFGLSRIAPKGVSTSILNLAVEFAYNIFKHQPKAG